MAHHGRDKIESRTPPAGSPLARWWIHEPGVTFLNHGSFGGCPQAVLETQAAWRARLEGEPVRFFAEDLFGLIDWVRGDVARFVGCDGGGLVFVPNATTGVATAIHNLITSGQAAEGSEVLLTDHEYPACANNLRHMAGAAGLEVVTAKLPFPSATPEDVIDAVLGAVTARTRIALLSHITSASAMVLPVARLVAELEGRGVRVIIDGAHAPGHVDLDIESLSPSYYAANLHKWVCSPKGSAILWVHPEQRARCRPMILSNLANKPIEGRPHLHTEFDYVGTNDPTSVLAVPAAIRIMAAIATGQPPRRYSAEAFNLDPTSLDDAWRDIRKRNHELALQGQRTVSEALDTEPPAPASMTGCIALIELPSAEADAWERLAQRPTKHADPLQDRLIAEWGIQVPVLHPIAGESGGVPRRFVRISAQLYNNPSQYAYLAEALHTELAGERGEAPYTDSAAS